MIHPITFSIPEEKIVNAIPTKTKLLSSLVPGIKSTYIYENETDYYNEYKQSLFATTTQKHGWDCLRHYEIMACGTIPYFPNLEQCPMNTMALLPKPLLQQGNRLYLKLKEKQRLDLSALEWSECLDLIEALLAFLRQQLTTQKVARYVLEKAQKQDCKNILYLSGDIQTDYLRCLTLHGFKQDRGTSCHDYPKIPHLYQDHGIPPSHLYGKGMSYSGLLEPSLHDHEKDQTVQDDIINHKYDLIVYGSLHRGMPFYYLVMQHYQPDEIILFCGEDNYNAQGVFSHFCGAKQWKQKGHHVFVRELI